MTCRPRTSRRKRRLYDQVKPLYQDLHCYARKRLAQRYGKDKVPDGKPIPAQLLGNMWAQQWNRIFDDLLKPYPAASIESADRQLQAQKWDAVRSYRGGSVLKEKTFSYLDLEKVRADYSDGVLKLQVPVAEKAKPRKVDVNTSRDTQSAISA